VTNQNSVQGCTTNLANNPALFRKINQQNRDFWEEQNKLRDQRISVDVIFTIATKDMRSETSRGIAVRAQKSFEQALADAEDTLQLVRSDFSKKGGRKHKSDSLQDLILKLVRENARITGNQLLGRLKTEAGEGIITAVDGWSDVLAGETRKIRYFDEHTEQDKTAPLPGLKHRLSRAKKCIRANRQMRPQ
jgi:hypothetical protein